MWSFSLVGSDKFETQQSYQANAKRLWMQQTTMLVGFHLHKMLALLRRQLQQNKLLSCTLLQKFAFLHLQIKLFSTDAPKKNAVKYSKDICPNIHMIFQQPFIMKSWLLQQQQLWSYSLAGSDYAPLVCHPLQLAKCNPRLNSRIVHLKIRKSWK